MTRSRERGGVLFAGVDLHTWLQQRLHAALEEVEVYDADRLLGTPVEALTTSFVSKNSVVPIDIKDAPGDIEADEPTEVVIEVNEFGERRSKRGTRTRFHVPFTGNADLFYTQGSISTSQHPRATIADGRLVLVFQELDDDPEKLKAGLTEQLRLVRHLLSGVTPSVSDFNNKLPNLIQERIEQRRNKVSSGKKALAATGFKIRPRPGAETYAPPVVRRTVVPTPPSTAPAAPEPTLDDAIYDEVLRVIKHAMLTAERSPTVFKSMGEEDIRQIILLFLNAVFEGEALAEAFNFSGKTDILIRHQGKNVFVAECKFWTGPASLSGAIDQLLSYTTWRDTKTAIVLLNRGVAFSTLLARAPEVLRKHKSFVRESALGGDASFRAILSRPGDPARHVVLTVLAFDLPR